MAGGGESSGCGSTGWGIETGESAAAEWTWGVALCWV